ncbi:MAG: hypothetical protein M1825_005558 [Sarcosagium campestre]|nr:MAG: hypothetical protein M1825_005558 [Sarcosagium campestre]
MFPRDPRRYPGRDEDSPTRTDASIRTVPAAEESVVRSNKRRLCATDFSDDIRDGSEQQLRLMPASGTDSLSLASERAVERVCQSPSTYKRSVQGSGAIQANDGPSNASPATLGSRPIKGLGDLLHDYSDNVLAYALTYYKRQHLKNTLGKAKSEYDKSRLVRKEQVDPPDLAEGIDPQKAGCDRAQKDLADNAHQLDRYKCKQRNIIAAIVLQLESRGRTTDRHEESSRLRSGLEQVEKTIEQIKHQHVDANNETLAVARDAKRLADEAKMESSQARGARETCLRLERSVIFLQSSVDALAREGSSARELQLKGLQEDVLESQRDICDIRNSFSSLTSTMKEKAVAAAAATCTHPEHSCTIHQEIADLAKRVAIGACQLTELRQAIENMSREAPQMPNIRARSLHDLVEDLAVPSRENPVSFSAVEDTRLQNHVRKIRQVLLKIDQEFEDTNKTINDFVEDTTRQHSRLQDTIASMQSQHEELRRNYRDRTDAVNRTYTEVEGRVTTALEQSQPRAEASQVTVVPQILSRLDRSNEPATACRWVADEMTKLLAVKANLEAFLAQNAAPSLLPPETAAGPSSTNFGRPLPETPTLQMHQVLLTQRNVIDRTNQRTDGLAAKLNLLEKVFGNVDDALRNLEATQFGATVLARLHELEQRAYDFKDKFDPVPDRLDRLNHLVTSTASHCGRLQALVDRNSLGIDRLSSALVSTGARHDSAQVDPSQSNAVQTSSSENAAEENRMIELEDARVLEERLTKTVDELKGMTLTSSKRLGELEHQIDQNSASQSKLRAAQSMIATEVDKVRKTVEERQKQQGKTLAGDTAAIEKKLMDLLKDTQLEIADMLGSFEGRVQSLEHLNKK